MNRSEAVCESSDVLSASSGYVFTAKRIALSEDMAHALLFLHSNKILSFDACNLVIGVFLCFSISNNSPYRLTPGVNKRINNGKVILLISLRQFRGWKSALGRQNATNWHH